ncbi:hypothetical protein EDB86DRAFT_2795562, partial [Lactarius hatsudake]
NEQSVRTWVDAFFLRTSAMVSSDKQMVLCLENWVPKTATCPPNSTTISGLVDYTAIIAHRKLGIEAFFSNPTFEKLRTTRPFGFFVAEAKKRSEESELKMHLPQVIGEMYASMRHLRTYTLRGALTDGHSWIFIIIKLNSDGNGARYRSSTPIRFQKGQSLQLQPPWPDVLTGILLHWIENSFVDIGDEDWFNKGPKK